MKCLRAFLVLSSFWMVACSGGNPAAPSPQTQVTATPTPTPVPTPTATSLVNGEEGKTTFTTNDNGLTVTVRNGSTTHTNSYFFAIFWKPRENSWVDQKYLNGEQLVLGPLEQKTVKRTPPVGCSEFWQSDIFFGVALADIGVDGDNIHPHTGIYSPMKWWMGKNESCPPPTPPTLPPPAPTCEGVSLTALVVSRTDTETSVSVLLKVTWKGTGSVVVEWGDGKSTLFPLSDTQVPYSYLRGTTVKVYKALVKYSQTGLACDRSFEVEVQPLIPPPPPPPPLTCAQTNPPSFSASGDVVQTSNNPDRVRVTIDYEYGNIQNEKIALYWMDKWSQWVKKSAPLNLACEDGKKKLVLEWTSYDYFHLPNNGNGVKYFILRYTGSDPTSLSDPDITWQQEIW